MNLKPLKTKIVEAVLEYLENRFGIDSGLFYGMDFLQNEKGRVFALSKTAASFAERRVIACISLPFVRLDASVKPTSAMIQVFGNHATKNVVTIDRNEAKDFIQGFDLYDVKHNCERGYVIIKYKDFPLGCGLLRENNVKNMLPKAKRMPVEML
ncbi:MAG: hypothetical protein KAS32_18085 [Candidatus Peribacteraceae bacterium]|nr:hypothetical protein [Candidatus Peribacteraceae bacterium]